MHIRGFQAADAARLQALRPTTADCDEQQHKAWAMPNLPASGYPHHFS